jgi:hypothetical protein
LGYENSYKQPFAMHQLPAMLNNKSIMKKENAMRKTLFVLVACAAVTVTACSPPGEGGSLPDPAIGLWQITSIHGVAPTADPTGTMDWTFSVLADGSFNGGFATDMAAFGGANNVFFGYWSNNSNTWTGHIYAISPATSAQLATATVSGDTLTLSTSSGSDHYVITCTRASAPSSSDAMIGLWNETSITPTGTGVTSEVWSCRSDGAMLAGVAADGSGSFGTGHTIVFGYWSSGSPYSLTTYGPGTTASAENATVNGSTSQITGGGYVTDGGRGSAPSASDPIIGVWRLSSANPAPAGTFDSTISFQADGSFSGGQAANDPSWGTGSSVIFGKWSNSGTYTLTTYVSKNTMHTAIPQTVTVNGNTLTVPNTGPTGTATLTFTRY